MDEKIFFILCFYQAIEPTYSSVDLGVKNRCHNPAHLPYIKKCVVRLRQNSKTVGQNSKITPMDAL